MSYQSPQPTNNEELQIKETWSKLWNKKNGEQIDSWDALSEIVLANLLHECISGRDHLRQLRIVEAGCGTGRICRELLKEAMDVCCLDISPQALDLARNQIGNSASYILGSILDMPKGIEVAPFDVVWNSGVMEHFSPQDQKKALREFFFSLKKNKESSLVITFTPYSQSFLYRFGKMVLEKLGKWPFGREIPVATLADVGPDELTLEKEYSVAFLPLLLDAYKWLPPLRTISRLSFSLILKVFGREGFRKIDRFFSSIFGGYLLVSVFKIKSGK